jgi:Dockerin type I domain
MASTRIRLDSRRFCSLGTGTSAIARGLAWMIASVAPILLSTAAAHAGGWSGFGCLPQDLNADGEVNGADLATLLGAWGLSGHPADFDGINGVDGADLGSMLGAWGSWPLADCLEVDSIDPEIASPGDIVSLVGHFPDPNVDNYCVVSLNDAGEVIPFEVLAVDSTKLMLQVGPSNAEGTTSVMIGLGDGDTGLPGELTPGVGYGTAPWSWSTDQAGLMTNVLFKLESGDGISGSFYGTLDGGALRVVINGDCPAGTKFAIWPRAHHYATGPGDPYVGFDCFIPCVEIFPGSDEFSCAQQICSVVTNVYAAHVPPIAVTCTVATVSGGTELTLKLNGLSIDWGVFNIEVLTDDGDCGPGPGNCTPECPCDVNGDGQVNQADLLFIKNSFGPCPGLGVFCCADLNGDQEVNIADIGIFLNCAPCPVVCNPACPCDVNGDGAVNQLDLQAIQQAFGICDGDCCADLNGDGVVNVIDNGGCGPIGGCNADCPCDVNVDGVVDNADLAFIQANFGPCDIDPCCTDLDGDGDTDGADVQAWLSCGFNCVPN